MNRENLTVHTVGTLVLYCPPSRPAVQPHLVTTTLYQTTGEVFFFLVGRSLARDWNVSVH